jgi:1,5-anhydro-D-fructose reductase (1,5-anhydro-D-mannitol-forming)
MTVRWGIIGCGDVCEVKSGPAFYKIPGSALVSVMRRDRERARDFAARHGAKRYTSNADDLIFDPEVDAVYVATPPGTHLKYALRVAEASKPCYVEKPMARSAMECRQMIQAFEMAGQPLFVAYYRRALPRFLRVKEILESDRLGTLLAVHYDHVGQVQEKREPGVVAGWRESVLESGGGLFLDLGSHVLDLLDYLLGPMHSVWGDAERRSPPRAGQAPVEDNVVMSFRFSSGVLGTASFAFHARYRYDRLRFVGQQGQLSLTVFGNEPLELSTQGTTERIEVAQPEHVQLPLISTIVDELSGKDVRCPSRGRSALRTADAMDAVLSSFYNGRDDTFWTRPETWRKKDG